MLLCQGLLTNSWVDRGARPGATVPPGLHGHRTAFRVRCGADAPALKQDGSGERDVEAGGVSVDVLVSGKAARWRSPGLRPLEACDIHATSQSDIPSAQWPGGGQFEPGRPARQPGDDVDLLAERVLAVGRIGPLRLTDLRLESADGARSRPGVRPPQQPYLDARWGTGKVHRAGPVMVQVRHTIMQDAVAVNRTPHPSGGEPGRHRPGGRQGLPCGGGADFRFR